MKMGFKANDTIFDKIRHDLEEQEKIEEDYRYSTCDIIEDYYKTKKKTGKGMRARNEG